jgi:hypothetical protein
MQTKRPNPHRPVNAQAALASVNAAIFSAIICQHSSAPSGPPRVIFKRRIMITPFASKPNSAASIHDFQNNTSRPLLLHREATMKSAALGSARRCREEVWREAQPASGRRDRSARQSSTHAKITSGSLPARPKSCPRYARAAQLLFGRLGLLVDCGLGDFGEGLVRGLFLIQRFLQQFDGVIETEFLRPGLQRAVARNLVVLYSLG